MPFSWENLEDRQAVVKIFIEGRPDASHTYWDVVAKTVHTGGITDEALRQQYEQTKQENRRDAARSKHLARVYAACSEQSDAAIWAALQVQAQGVAEACAQLKKWVDTALPMRQRMLSLDKEWCDTKEEVQARGKTPIFDMEGSLENLPPYDPSNMRSEQDFTVCRKLVEYVTKDVDVSHEIRRYCMAAWTPDRETGKPRAAPPPGDE